MEEERQKEEFRKEISRQGGDGVGEGVRTALAFPYSLCDIKRS